MPSSTSLPTSSQTRYQSHDHVDPHEPRHLDSSASVWATHTTHSNGNGTNPDAHRSAQADSEPVLAINSQQYQKGLASFLNDDDDEHDLGGGDAVQGRNDADEDGDSSIGTVRRARNGVAAADAADGDGHDDDDEDESFTYTGADSTFDQPDKATSDGDSDSYSAKMREILGSDDDDDESAQSPAAKDPGQNGDGRSVYDNDEDESFQYPGVTPHDVSYDATSGSLDARFPPAVQTLPGTPSSSSSRMPQGWSSLRIPILPTPQRPSAYPTLSRLRSSVGLGSREPYPSAATSSLPGLGMDTPSSSSRYQRSPLPFAFTSPSGSTSQPAAQAVPSPPSISSARSRDSSFSFSAHPQHLGGRTKKRARSSFPYGPNAEQGLAGAPALSDARQRAAFASDTLSLLSDAPFSEGGRVDNVGSDREEAGPSRGVLKEAVEEDGEMRRDFVRWSALRKIAAQVAAVSGSEAQTVANGKGDATSTALAVSSSLIAIGTSKGKALVFEYSQEIKCTCDSNDVAGPPGAVSALAFSSDHTFLAVGHESGNIFLYDLNSPSRPARHVPSVALSAVKAGKREGHLNGSKIVHIGFVGLRHTAIVSADSKGLSFYHALGKILGVSSNDTLRLLGRYPQHEHEYELGLSVSKRSTVFGMAPLPLGPRPHAADSHHFVAIMTIGKLVLVGLKPAARTWYRKLRPKRTKAAENGAAVPDADAGVEGGEDQNDRGVGSSAAALVPGSLSWYPASTELDGRRSRQTNPILAFSFGDRLHLVRLVSRQAKARKQQQQHADARLAEPSEEIDVVELTGSDGLQEKGDILTLQWLSPDLLLLVMKNGLALFDCRAGTVTERMQGDSAEAVVQRLVEHEWYDPVLGIVRANHMPSSDEIPEDALDRPSPTPPGSHDQRSWAVSHSVRTSKGKTFFLTRNELVVGTLLSWADRLLNYVMNGDFLSAIELATLTYKNHALGSAVGLPSDPEDRREVTARKLRELMAASAEYSFSPDRLTDSTHVTPDGRGVDRTALFRGLARVCARASLALDDLRFLFDVLYDRYEDNGIEAIFVAEMEQFIVSGELRTLPIPVVQRLLAFRKKQGEYDLAETIIWHVDPKSLDLDQALSLCIEQKLYDAMIYVYNAALRDYVAPIIELLVPLKRILHVRRRVVARLRVAKLRNRPTTQDGGEDRSRPALPSSQPSSLDIGLADTEEGDEQEFEDAYKVFSYLSVVLTGHQYPSQEPIAEDSASNAAKTSIYSFVFSGRCMLWPPGPGGKLVLFGLEDDGGEDESMLSPNAEASSSEPIYPYLRLFLEFDAEAFLDALDLAFEDSFLDDEDLVGKRISRQLVVDILLELSKPSSTRRLIKASDDRKEDAGQPQSAHPDDSDDEVRDQPALPALSRTFVNIFIARNAPKYPQFIKLGQSDVNHLLQVLSLPDFDESVASDEEAPLTAQTREDRQLAAEYLLSTYKLEHTEQRLDDFEKAGFKRILQSAFRQSGKWDRLLAMLLRDSFAVDTPSVASATMHQGHKQAFAHIEEVIVKASRSKERAEMMPKLHALLVESIGKLLHADPLQTVAIFDRFFSSQHSRAIAALQEQDEDGLLLFLRCFFEPMLVLQRLSGQGGRQTPADASQEAPADSSESLPASNGVVADQKDAIDQYDETVAFASPNNLDEESRDLFIELLSRRDPSSIVRNLDARGAGFFDLDTVIVFCRNEPIGAGDAVLWCLDRLGRAKEAFDELDKILAGAAAELGDTLDSASVPSTGQLDSWPKEKRLLKGVRHAVNMAVRLCIERANDFSGLHDSDDEDTLPSSPRKGANKVSTRIDADEIWFRLLRSLVKLVHNVAELAPDPGSASSPEAKRHPSIGEREQITASVDDKQGRITFVLAESREIVQETLSMLIASTAAEAVSFPDLFRRLVGEGGSTDGGAPLAKYYTEVRAVLEGMLGAYKLRSDLLKITNKLFDRDTFNEFRRLTVQRKRGWRPGSGHARCSGCGQVAVGRERGRPSAADRADQTGPALAGQDPAASARWSTLPTEGAAMGRRSSREAIADVSLRRQVLRNNSSSSLAVPQTPLLRRRPATPYDDKAAPLSSPSIDKGKGVVRNIGGDLGGDDGEMDGYFAGSSALLRANSSSGPMGSQGMYYSASADSMMLRSASSSSGMSLRIDDGPRRDRSQTTPTMRTRSSSVTGLSAGNESMPRRQMSDSGYRGPSGAGDVYSVTADDYYRRTEGVAVDEVDRFPSFQSAVRDAVKDEDRSDEAIIVLRCGEVYHESCWQDAAELQPTLDNSSTVDAGR